MFVHGLINMKMTWNMHELLSNQFCLPHYNKHLETYAIPIFTNSIEQILKDLNSTVMTLQINKFRNWEYNLLQKEYQVSFTQRGIPLSQ